ncbi:hypothetical protein H0H93_011715 [Arthromyces matolae]|nr:hypothetical protein H0H93_011715 [Arthromyces matolae]
MILIMPAIRDNYPNFERTRPYIKPQRSQQYFVRVDGLKTCDYLGFKKNYNSQYPQLRTKKHLPSNLVRPTDPRPPGLDLPHLECVKVLGEGATGMVLLVRNSRNEHSFDRPGSLYALKVTTRRDARFCDKLNPEVRDIERSILTKLPWNPFVTGILQSFRDELNLYTMMECISCGSFRELLQTRAPFDAVSCAFYFSNIATGISFLADHNIYHRDLKPENILIGPNGYLVLVDFGEGAHACDYENTQWMQVGSPVYSAPELMGSTMDSELIFSSVDWWSAGVILYEMVYRKLPWWAGSPLELESKKNTGIIHWRPGVKIGRRLKSLISGLLTVNTATRLGADGAHEVLNHDWLKQVNWSKIKAQVYKAPYLPPKGVDLNQTWHKFPLPSHRSIPGLSNIKPVSPHLAYNDCFPKSNPEANIEVLSGSQKAEQLKNRETSNWPLIAPRHP